MNRPIIEYAVIAGHALWHLEREVNKAIVDGWEPLGGVEHVLESSFAQAVVKYDNSQGDQIAYAVHEINNRVHQT